MLFSPWSFVESAKHRRQTWSIDSCLHLNKPPRSRGKFRWDLKGFTQPTQATACKEATFPYTDKGIVVTTADTTTMHDDLGAFQFSPAFITAKQWARGSVQHVLTATFGKSLKRTNKNHESKHELRNTKSDNELATPKVQSDSVKRPSMQYQHMDTTRSNFNKIDTSRSKICGNSILLLSLFLGLTCPGHPGPRSLRSQVPPASNGVVWFSTQKRGPFWCPQTFFGIKFATIYNHLQPVISYNQALDMSIFSMSNMKRFSWM